MAEFISAHTGDEIDAAVASGSTTTGIIKDFTTLSGSLISGSTLHIVGNATVKGNTTIDGNTTVKGNLTFGDADSDSVNFGAEISSSLVPDADGTYTIGSSAKRWKEVHTDDIKVQGDISASGDLYLAGNDLFGGTTKRLTLGATNAFVGNITSTGNIVAEGNITANRYIVSSSVTNVTTLAQSGSTIFGDTPADDTHQFTGSVSVTGSVTSTGTITAEQITSTDDMNVTDDLIVGGDISSSGTISGLNGDFNGNFDVDGTTNLDNTDIDGTLNVDGNTTLGDAAADAHTITGKTSFVGNITASGNISSSGTVTAAAAVLTTVDINGGTINGITDLAVADGGTGAGTFTDGGVLLGSGTGAITAMAVLTDGQMIVGDGTTDPVAESGATLRTSIGVGTTDNVQFAQITGSVVSASSGIFTSVDIDGGSITGITDLAVADGGTGASTFTDGGILLGNGTGAIQATAVLTDGQMIVGDGTTDPAIESGATLRTSIGVGTGDNVQFTNITGTGNTTLGNAATDTHTITGHTTASGNISSSGTITGNSIVGTIGTAAQSNITSLGTLTTLTVDDITINASKIEDAGALEIEAGGDFHLDGAGEILLDSATSRIRALGNITASGDISSSGTISGLNGDFNGDFDVDGTTNLDVVDIDGAVNMAAPLTITSHITSSANIKSGGNLQLTASSAGQIIASGSIVSSVGIQSKPVTITATDNGSGSAKIPQHTATALINADSDANHIVELPAPVIGTVINLIETGTTGYELRTSTPGSIGINGGTGASVESAVAGAITYVKCVCVATTGWICSQYDADGDESKVEAAG